MKNTLIYTVSAVALVFALANSAVSVQVKTATVYSTSTNTVEGDGVQCIMVPVGDEQSLRIYTTAATSVNGGSLTGVSLDYPTVTNTLPATSANSFATTNNLGATWTTAVFCSTNAVEYPWYFHTKNATYKLRLRSVTAGETNKVVAIIY